MATPTKEDRERARAWWLRVFGYISTTDDRNVETLAAEFAAIREEAANANSTS
jgi:hypothetical protein